MVSCGAENAAFRVVEKFDDTGDTNKCDTPALLEKGRVAGAAVHRPRQAGAVPDHHQAHQALGLRPVQGPQPGPGGPRPDARPARPAGRAGRQVTSLPRAFGASAAACPGESRNSRIGRPARAAYVS
ncbi:LppU/SCO3897 family protein [Yinghuangia aomiensis]